MGHSWLSPIPLTYTALRSCLCRYFIGTLRRRIGLAFNQLEVIGTQK